MTTQNDKIGNDQANGDAGVAVDPLDATFATKMAAIRAAREALAVKTTSPPYDLSAIATSREFFENQARKLGKTLGGA